MAMNATTATDMATQVQRPELRRGIAVAAPAEVELGEPVMYW